MSLAAIERVLQYVGDPPLSAGEKIVLVGLAYHDGPGGCWVGIDTLCTYSGLKRRQVQYQLAGLRDRGVIEVQRNAGGTERTRLDRRPNRYVLHLDGTHHIAPRDEDGAHSTAPREPGHGVQQDAPRDADGVHSMVERGALSGTNGVHHSAPEPNPEPSENTPTSSEVTHDQRDRAGWEGTILDLAAGRAAATREHNGWGAAGPGAVTKLRSAAAEHLESAHRWRAAGASDTSIADALAARLTGATDAAPSGLTTHELPPGARVDDEGQLHPAICGCQECAALRVSA